MLPAWKRESRDKLWLSGRFVSAKRDVEELTAKKEEVLQEEVLKARIAMSWTFAF